MALYIWHTIGTYCSTWYVEVPKFQTWIFVEWIAPFISKEGFQMSQAQDNDTEGGILRAFARTELGPSDVYSRGPPSVQGSKYQLRHTAAGGMFQTSVVHFFPNSLSDERPYQYFWITLKMQFEFVCVLIDTFYLFWIQAFTFLFHSWLFAKRFLFIIAFSSVFVVVVMVEVVYNFAIYDRNQLTNYK